MRCSKFVALLLAVTLVFSSLPLAAFADENDTTQSNDIELQDPDEGTSEQDGEDSDDQSDNPDVDVDDNADEVEFEEEVIDSEEPEAPPVARSATAAATAADVSDDKASVKYRAHVQNIGWQGWKTDKATAGTTGQSKRVEALQLSVTGSKYSGGITYSSHVQNIGWQAWKNNGATSGTTGQSKRVEAIKIKLTGEIANHYDVYYRAHSQTCGWMGWAKNGEIAGTSGYSYRMEALQIALVAKGGAAPGTTARPYVPKASVTYSSHVQKVGWQGWKTNGGTSGTSGRSLRLEAFKVKLNSSISGGIEYSSHVQNIGWQNAAKNGAVSGTSGRSLRMEAITIKLTGQAADYYDVYYRVHVQNFGWLGWAKNGAKAGSAGYSYRAEALQVTLVPKGTKAPGSTSNVYREVTYKSTGDSWLDGQLKTIAKANGNDLKKCFNYVAKFKYITGSTHPTGNWMVPYAKEMIQKKGGNCYRYAALFCALATYLGYDAKVVSGWVPSRSQGKAPHGWVEIKSGGKTYVCDPDMVHAYPNMNWYMMTYANAPLTYGRW